MFNQDKAYNHQCMIQSMKLTIVHANLASSPWLISVSELGFENAVLLFVGWNHSLGLILRWL